MIEMTHCVKLKLELVQCSSLLCSVLSLHKMVYAQWALTCRRQTRYHHMHCCQCCLPIGSLRVIWIPLPLDYPDCKIEHHWCCIDASLTFHWRLFWDMVMILSYAFFSWKAAHSSIMNQCSPTAPRFSNMQGQKLLMLGWRSLLGHCSNVVANIYT